MGRKPVEGRRLSVSTLKSYLACLQALFDVGSECREVPGESRFGRRRANRKTRTLNENNQRDRILSSHEPGRYPHAPADAVLRRPSHRPGDGPPLSEQLNLRWKDVHFDTGFIHVGENRTRKQVGGKRTKSGKDRRVPILPEVARLSQSLPSYNTSEYVFPAIRNDGPMGRHGGLRQAFDKAVRAAGVEDFTWHDCRHTFASHLAMSGVPLYEIPEFHSVTVQAP